MDGLEQSPFTQKIQQGPQTSYRLTKLPRYPVYNSKPPLRHLTPNGDTSDSQLGNRVQEGECLGKPVTHYSKLKNLVSLCSISTCRFARS